MCIPDKQSAPALREGILTNSRRPRRETVIARESSGSTPAWLAWDGTTCQNSTDCRLLAAVREEAALKERQRLSRELHDTVSQTLYAIAVSANTARELAEPDASDISEIDHLRQLAERGISEARALISQLRQESPGAEGLVIALTELVDTMSAKYGISVQVQLEAEPATTPEIRQALFRIAQEALRNVVKHAAARHVLLRLLTGHNSVTLVVEDDGAGFDPQGFFPCRLGLHSMRERAHEAGGSLEVTSRPRTRTRVRATVPLVPPALFIISVSRQGVATVRPLVG